MLRTTGRLIALVPILLLRGCVPHADIEGAPCDCPNGYDCCQTLSACVEVGGECPSAYPESSGYSCTADSQCPRIEACRIWKADGSLYGPSDCRRLCPGEYPCHLGEVCDLVLANAGSLVDLELVWVCVPEEPEAGCEDAGCRDCTREQAGELFCAGGDVHACRISVEPVCGVTCTRELLQDCAGTCSDDGGAHCVP
jgi:hypothetical protein